MTIRDEVDHAMDAYHGDDLQCEVPVSFVQSTLGSEIQVPTLNGSARINVPPGTQSGTILMKTSCVYEYKRDLHVIPEYFAAYNTIGFVLHKKGDLDGAEAKYRRAIEIVPDHIAAHYNLGVLLKEKGDLVGAEFQQVETLKDDCARCLFHQPDNPNRHIHIDFGLRINRFLF